MDPSEVDLKAVVDEVVASLSDILRYTVIHSHEEYEESVLAFHAAFAKVAKVVKMKNYCHADSLIYAVSVFPFG